MLKKRNSQKWVHEKRSQFLSDFSTENRYFRNLLIISGCYELIEKDFEKKSKILFRKIIKKYVFKQNLYFQSGITFLFFARFFFFFFFVEEHQFQLIDIFRLNFS